MTPGGLLSLFMREAAWEDRAMGAEYQPIENYRVIGNMRTAYHRKAARCTENAETQAGSVCSMDSSSSRNPDQSWFMMGRIRMKRTLARCQAVLFGSLSYRSVFPSVSVTQYKSPSASDRTR
jgi:hypothetical protein